MKRLDGIRATGRQTLNAFASNGKRIDMTFVFYAAIQEWFINVTYETFELTGFRIFASPNILQQYENIIPFGLAVTVQGGAEPFLISDFSSGRVNIYVLTPEEVEQVQEFYECNRDEG